MKFIDITIKTLDNVTRKLENIDENLTVKEFKDHIASKVNIPSQQQRLLHAGRVLQNNSTLADYNLDGRVIHLVERPPPEAYSNVPSSESSSTTTPTIRPGGVIIQTSDGDRHFGVPTSSSVTVNLNSVSAPGVPAFTNENAAVNRVSHCKRCILRARRIITRLEESLTLAPFEENLQGNPPTQESEGSMPSSYPAEEYVSLCNVLFSTQDRLRRLIGLVNNSVTEDFSNENVRQERERLMNGTAEALHFLSHAQHSLSDMYFDYEHATPRNILAQPAAIGLPISASFTTGYITPSSTPSPPRPNQNQQANNTSTPNPLQMPHPIAQHVRVSSVPVAIPQVSGIQGVRISPASIRIPMSGNVNPFMTFTTTSRNRNETPTSDNQGTQPSQQQQQQQQQPQQQQQQQSPSRRPPIFRPNIIANARDPYVPCYSRFFSSDSGTSQSDGQNQSAESEVDADNQNRNEVDFNIRTNTEIFMDDSGSELDNHISQMVQQVLARTMGVPAANVQIGTAPNRNFTGNASAAAPEHSSEESEGHTPPGPNNLPGLLQNLTEMLGVQNLSGEESISESDLGMISNLAQSTISSFMSGSHQTFYDLLVALRATTNTSSSENFLERIIMTAGRALSLRDVMQVVTMGNLQVLAQTRAPLAEMLRSTITISPNRDIVESVDAYLNIHMDSIKAAFAHGRYRSDVDGVATGVKFIRHFFIAFVSLVLDNDIPDVQFSNDIYALGRNFLYHATVLISSVLREEDGALRHFLSASPIQDFFVSESSALSELLFNFMRRISTATPEQVQKYIVNNDPDTNMASPPDQSMASKPLQTAEVQGASTPVVRPKVKEPTSETHSSLKRHIPEEWMNVIESDEEKQREMKKQKPFSDAYLGGMPTKRRQAAQQQSNNIVSSEGVSRMLQVASQLANVPLPETVTETAASCPILKASFDKAVKADLQQVLSKDDEFQPSKYPNAAKYAANN